MATYGDRLIYDRPGDPDDGAEVTYLAEDTDSGWPIVERVGVSLIVAIDPAIFDNFGPA
jgi:hypothetical protein